MNTSIAPLSAEYLKQVENNGPLVPALTCCGKKIGREDRSCAKCGKVFNVILKGHFNAESQKYRWLLYKEGDENEPIIPLTCGYCGHEITTRNRQCRDCRAYYAVEFRRTYAFPMEQRGALSWELRLWAYHDYISEKDIGQGIRILFAKTDEPAVPRPLPFDTSGLKLGIGILECPRCTNPYNARNLDQGYRCQKHKMNISAVLVRHPDGQISVERRAWNYIKQQPYMAIIDDDDYDYNPIMCRLDCPKCDTPIKDKHLRCNKSTCGFIVDVGCEQQPITNLRGEVTTTHTIVKIMLRPWTAIVRPEGLLTIEDAPTPETMVAEIDEAKAARERYELYLQARKLIRKHKWRGAAEILGMSLGSLQYFMKNPPPKPND